MTSTREAAATGSEQAEGRRGFFRELPFLIVVAFVLALLLKTFVVQAFYIPSSSMEPTLQVGDRVLVNKLAYAFREPRRGEVVVFAQDAVAGPDERGPLERLGSALLSGFGLAQSGEKDFIKRIIGLPGDTVEGRDGDADGDTEVHVNGEALPEALATADGYLLADDGGPCGDFEAVTVEAGQYFMLGDNRPNSADSRCGLGQIPRDAVIGRAFVVIWPVPAVATLPIAEYDPAPPDVAASGGRS